jgi:hypothetical protein
VGAATYLRKVKRGKGDGLWGAYIVDHDEFGLWLFTPARSPYRGTDGDHHSICYAGWPEPPGAPVIHLIPAGEWWFARWQRTPPAPHVAIDICTPARLVDGVWSYDDLELDLVKFTDGHWELVDEDNFDEARRSGYIDDEEASMSMATAGALATRLATEDELFDAIGWDKLEQYSNRPYAALVTLPR